MKVVDLNGRNAWPMWMPDGKQLYFMSERSGAQNIWTITPGGKARQVTKFTSGRVLWPSISYDGKSVVFERDFKIWQLDTKSGEAYALPITLVGSAASPELQHLTLTQFSDLELSRCAETGADGARRDLCEFGERRRRVVRVTQTPGGGIAGNVVARFAGGVFEPARCRQSRLPLRFRASCRNTAYS